MGKYNLYYFLNKENDGVIFSKITKSHPMTQAPGGYYPYKNFIGGIINSSSIPIFKESTIEPLQKAIKYFRYGDELTIINFHKLSELIDEKTFEAFDSVMGGDRFDVNQLYVQEVKSLNDPNTFDFIIDELGIDYIKDYSGSMLIDMQPYNNTPYENNKDCKYGIRYFKTILNLSGYTVDDDETADYSRNFRALDHTETGYIIDNEGNLTYGYPLNYAKYLISNQGTAYPDFKGTCGLCAVANVLRLAGINVDEKMIVDEYLNTLALPKFMLWAVPLIKIFKNIKNGTSASARKTLLKHYGIDSDLIASIPWNNKRFSNKEIEIIEQEKINEIAEFVEKGLGVIVSFDATWYNSKKYKNHGSKYPTHAVVVTGVTRNKEGNIIGFYIHDSNGDDSEINEDNRIPAIKFSRSLMQTDINVTKSIIR